MSRASPDLEGRSAPRAAARGSPLTAQALAPGPSAVGAALFVRVHVVLLFIDTKQLVIYGVKVIYSRRHIIFTVIYKNKIERIDEL